jgi:hypothetical protein
MDDGLKQLVRARAKDRCEYCRLPQDYAAYLRFQIEHIIAKQHGGKDAAGNLALACPHCHLHKGPNLTGIDPLTRKLVRLFHPRRHMWARHFRWEGAVLVGRTAVGRTTVAVLNMNDEDQISVREALRAEGVFPPSVKR